MTIGGSMLRAGMIRSALVVGALALGLSLAPGASASTYIQGGKTANEGQFPWMASVFINTPLGEALCSATVIAPTVILTAGHCSAESGGTPNPASWYTVTTGSINRTAGVKTGVSSVAVYPGYTERNILQGSGRDAGLLVLSRPVSAPPVPLGQDTSLVKANTEGFAAGWGLTSPNGLEAAELLQWTNMHIQCVGSLECANNTMSLTEIYVENSSAKGTCEGDSGGPLWREAASGPVEIGLTSRGSSNSCSATVFTNVETIRPWIEEQMGAGAPELGRCLKVTAGTGGYGNSTCTAAEGTKTYGWEQAFGSEKPLAKSGFKTAIKVKTTLALETAAKQKVTCTGESSAGQYTTLKGLAVPALVLTGCKNAAAEACTSSGAAAGEIRSGELTGQFGILKTEAPTTKDKVGVALRPASGETLAAFNCGATAFVVRGAVIGETKADAMVSAATLKFAQAKGAQKWTHFEVGGTLALEAKVGAGAYEKAGLALTAVQTNEEKLELSSVV